MQLQACTVDHHSNTKAAQLESAWGRFEIRGKLQMSLFKQHAASARHVAAVARMTGAQGVDPLSKAPSAGDFASVLGAVRAGKASHGEGIAGTSRRAKVRVRHTTKIKCSPHMLSTILVQACPDQAAASAPVSWSACWLNNNAIKRPPFFGVNSCLPSVAFGVEGPI